MEPSRRPTPSFYVGMFLAASLSPLGSTMIAVALPSIGSELGIGSGALTQWLVSSYLIVGIATMSPGGKLGDRIGHRRALVIGMAIYGAGSIVGFVVANLPSLALDHDIELGPLAGLNPIEHILESRSRSPPPDVLFPLQLLTSGHDLTNPLGR